MGYMQLELLKSYCINQITNFQSCDCLMETAGQFDISSPQHEALFSLGSLTPNPFYIIYRHELSKILRELAIYGTKYKKFI